MIERRRTFLEALLKLGSLFAASRRVTPFATTGPVVIPVTPAIDRVLGRGLLPGHASTLMLLGTNLRMVERLVFRDRRVTAETLEQSDGHVLVRLTVPDDWRSHTAQMRVQLTTGRRLRQPVELLVEQGALPPAQRYTNTTYAAGARQPYRVTGNSAAQSYKPVPSYPTGRPYYGGPVTYPPTRSNYRPPARQRPYTSSDGVARADGTVRYIGVHLL